MAIYFDRQQDISEKDFVEELHGKISSQKVEKKLMQSVLENDTDAI